MKVHSAAKKNRRGGGGTHYTQRNAREQREGKRKAPSYCYNNPVAFESKQRNDVKRYSFAGPALLYVHLFLGAKTKLGAYPSLQASAGMGGGCMCAMVQQI